MADHPIDFQLVADPVTFQRAANALVTVYDINDANNTTPLALKDLNGLALANPMKSTAEAITPPFISPVPDVKLVGGGYSIPVSSTKGIRDVATAAAASAEASAKSAKDAANLVGTPADPAVAALVDGDTETRAKLDGRYANAAGTTTALNGKVGKGEVAIRVGDYGVAADGTTDDTAKILSAANDAVSKGLPLVFDGSKRYNVNTGLTFPVGVRVQSNGATFVKTVNNNTFGLRTSDNFHADVLKLELSGGPASDAGVYVNGSDTIIDRIKVTSQTADQAGANALLIGTTATAKSNVRINQATLTGFRAPMRTLNLTGSRISNVTISNFTTGVYVINTTDTTFDKFKISGTSASSTGAPGQNGLLVESQNADYTTADLHFRDWTVDGSPEHAFRIGGAYTVANITFTECIAKNAGNAPGNVATGGASFKVLGAVGHLHYNIRYINCTAEDSNTSASGINNFGQFHIGMVDGLTLTNPTLRARNKTYSGQIGILVFASKNVEILQPSIRDVLRQALYVFKDSTEPSPPIGVSNLRVTGGMVDGGSAGIVVNLDAQSAAIKDLFIDNLVVSRGGQAVRAETPTTSGSDTGSYSNVNVKIKYVNAPTGSATAPITGGNLTVNDYTGLIYGTGSIPSLDGGTYLNASTGARYIRKSGNWVQQ